MNTANLAYVPFPKVTALAFNRVQGQIQVTFQEFAAPSTGFVPLNQATLRDANNYIFTKFNQHGPDAFKISSITVSPPTAGGSQVVTLRINGGKYLRGGHYFLDIRSVSPKDLTGIQDVFGNALDGEFYGFFPSGNNVPGGDFIAQLNAVHHTIFAPMSFVGTASPVVPPGTPESNTTIPTVNPSDPPAKATTHAKVIAHHQSVAAPKIVHHATIVHRNTAVAKSKHHGAATEVIDKALHQVTAERHHGS